MSGQAPFRKILTSRPHNSLTGKTVDIETLECGHEFRTGRPNGRRRPMAFRRRCVDCERAEREVVTQ